MASGFKIRYQLMVSCIIGGYALFLFFSSERAGHFVPCLFKLITGIPCPGCGMGRATLSLLHGEPVRSLSYNVLCIPFSAAIFASLVWMCKDLFTNRETFSIQLKKLNTRPAQWMLFAVIIVDWAINIYRHI